jgi:hypothetical protein
MKRKTVGVDWKVPITAGVSAIVWVIAHYTGIDLSLQVELIVSLILGALAGVAGPAPKTVPTSDVATVESGTSHMRTP